jgi:hypothetical protein
MMPTTFARLKPQVIARDGRICQYCGTTDAFSYSVDHIISRSQGGIDHLANLVVACQQCNTLKRGRVWVPRNFDTISMDHPQWREEVYSRAVAPHQSQPTVSYTLRMSRSFTPEWEAFCKAHGFAKGGKLAELGQQFMAEYRTKHDTP